MSYTERFAEWKEKVDDEELKAELDMIAGDEREIENRFYAELEFGTGGLRGKIGAGTYYMNKYTVGKATQGIAAYMNRNGLKSCVIGYDSRNKSPEFARLSAKILAANGIKTYVFDTLIPTPVVSYAIRKLKCGMGIMITASHNPKEYNGYKAYNNTGCQIANEMADAIYAEITKIDAFDGVKSMCFREGGKNGLIESVPAEIYDSYLKEVASNVVKSAAGTPLKVLYTPLNGTGNKPVRDIFKMTGIANVKVVEVQENPDSQFTTCPYPNPEFSEAFREAFKIADTYAPDIIIATDPDADRVGIAVRDKKGIYVLMTGNEVGLIFMDYFLKNKPFTPDSVVVKTIVSTALTYKMAEKYGIKIADTLTGFKFIGDYLNGLEKTDRLKNYVFGFEESYGYLIGTHARDKDAVVASMLIAEIAANALKEDKTLIDIMMQIYADYGYVSNKTLNFAFEGAKGKQEMNKLLSGLRAKEVTEIGGYNIANRTDFLNDVTGLPKSDVIRYTLVNGEVIIRPSGTEPKMKAYLTAITDNTKLSSDMIAKLEAGVNKLLGKK